jgi:HAD superfamily hydrolase (TIGR01509 family)
MNSQFQNVNAILFDAGSTLLTEDSIYQDRVQRTIALNQRNLTDEDFLKGFQEASLKRMNPYIYTCDKLGIKKRVPWDFSSEAPYPGVKEMLHSLQSHYQLAIVANQPPDFDVRIKKLGLWDYFTAVIGSDDYGFRKPDPAIFLLALHKLRVKPEEAIMVGDRLENDIAPAKKLGLKTIWVKQGFARYQNPENEEEKPTASLDSITELAQLLL